MYVYVKNCCFHCICEAHPRRVAAGARVRLPGCRVVQQDLTSRAGWLVRNAVRCRGLLPMAESLVGEIRYTCFSGAVGRHEMYEAPSCVGQQVHTYVCSIYATIMSCTCL
jgi:hypothetical protein